MTTGIDNDSNADTKNTAGATLKQSETLFLIGAGEQSTSAQTYTSSGITMCGPSITSNMLDVNTAMFLPCGEGATIEANDGLYLRTGTYIDSIDSLVVTGDAYIDGNEVATED